MPYGMRAVPSMIVCRDCGVDHFRSSFSSEQLLPWGNQTCKDCTSRARGHYVSTGGYSRSRSRSPGGYSSSSRSRSPRPICGSPGYDYNSYNRGAIDGSGDGSDSSSDGGSGDYESDDERGYEENADISDVRYSGPNLEGFLSNHGWDLEDDSGLQGVYYRSNEQSATLTIWWQTGRYRTKLDRDEHPSGRNNQMFGPTSGTGRRVIRDIMEVARHVRMHTNNRYSDRRH